MVLPNLKRHLKEKNTLSDHDSIHGHRNLNETERSVIAHYRNFNAPKICKITVVKRSGLVTGMRLYRFSVSDELSPGTVGSFFIRFARVKYR